MRTVIHRHLSTFLSTYATLFDNMQFFLPLTTVAQQADVTPRSACIAAEVCLVDTRKI